MLVINISSEPSEKKLCASLCSNFESSWIIPLLHFFFFSLVPFLWVKHYFVYVCVKFQLFLNAFSYYTVLSSVIHFLRVFNHKH